MNETRTQCVAKTLRGAPEAVQLCLPASVSYWVNASGSSPRLCLHKGLDPKMVKALEGDILP